MVYEPWFTSHGLRSIVYEPWFTEAEVNRQEGGAAGAATAILVLQKMCKQRLIWNFESLICMFVYVCYVCFYLGRCPQLMTPTTVVTKTTEIDD